MGSVGCVVGYVESWLWSMAVQGLGWWPIGFLCIGCKTGTRSCIRYSSPLSPSPLSKHDTNPNMQRLSSVAADDDGTDPALAAGCTRALKLLGDDGAAPEEADGNEGMEVDDD